MNIERDNLDIWEYVSTLKQTINQLKEDNIKRTEFYTDELIKLRNRVIDLELRYNLKRGL